MPEFLLILGSDKQFRSFQHRLHHDTRYFRNLHHPFKLQRQMLFTLYIQYHTAYIGFVHRPHHLCHYRESGTTGKCKHLFLVCRHKLLHYRNTGRMQQSLHVMRFYITVFGDGINDAADARNIHAKQLYFIIRRFRGIHNARQCRTQCHFIGKVHVTFGKESGHFGSCRINGRKDGEYRFPASLHLLMQHIVHFEHGDQSRCTENSHYRIHIIKLLFAIFQTKTQMLRRTRS